MSTKVDPKAVLAAIVIASSLAYATPIGMPANTMVYNIAGYSFLNYVKASVPLIVVSSIVGIGIIANSVPFLIYKVLSSVVDI